MNEDNGLYSFLRTKAASPEEDEADIDWKARKTKWLGQVTRLYDLIKSWLEPLEKDETVTYLTANVSVKEDYIGSYDVEVLTLLIGKQRVEFYPKGTLIIGAAGRVDVRGPRAVRSLILNDGNWFVVERSPRLTTLPFNQDSFHDVLQEVMQ